MPAPPKVSPVTGDPVSSDYVHTTDCHFRDQHGRALLLRGVNLSGSSKAPIGQSSRSRTNFLEDAEAGKGGFINRPLNLEDGSADVHMARLRAWGYNFLRFVFTWEALEHEGPGKYDREYMDYIVQVLRKCGEWGFRVFMDPHQDVWSRFSGGSGAPLWTLYACGIDPLNISPTYAALLHNEYPSREDPRPQDFPQMIWATNYTHLLSQTIFTLFYAGKTYAPKCTIDGKNIQDWLQDHFLDAVVALADRIGQEDDLFDKVVLGWDSMNEPGNGFIGRENLAEIPKDQQLKKGPSPTPLQGLILGMGGSAEVDVWDFTQMGPKHAGTERLDAKGTILWLKPEDEATRGGGKWGWKRGDEWELGRCIWAQHGVWDSETLKLLRPDYFRTTPADPSRRVNLVEDFWRPHWLSYASRIRRHHPEAIHFIQPPVFEIPPKFPESFLSGRACTAPHYYDGLTLMTKHWNWFNADALGLVRQRYWSVLQALKIGESAIRHSVQQQLGILKSDTAEAYGSYPTLIGEIGCPFDMDDKKAYGFVDGGKGEGDYSSQTKAWDCSLNAADGPNCLNYTVWTYVPDNCHEWGDNWNNEDLSIWSPDDVETEIYSETGKDSETTSTSVIPVHQSQSPTSSHSHSMASSTTLGPRTRKAFTPRGIQGGEEVTASLILDGCRAIGATCRPFPIATVGTPETIEFNISTSLFRFESRVRADDVASDEVMTEIYLPFAHYAASLEPLTTSPNESAASSTVELLSKGKPSSDPVAPKIKISAPLKLDVEVRVSHGRISISGQSLKWFYDVPKTGDAVYFIEVRRRGGPLVRDLGWVQRSNWGELCPSCTIA